MGRLSMVQKFRMLQSLLLVDALLPLDGGRRREGENKGERNLIGEGGFPSIRLVLLAMPGVRAVWYN
jgi:hypothetical protein